jgi:hypothetical protein
LTHITEREDELLWMKRNERGMEGEMVREEVELTLVRDGAIEVSTTERVQGRRSGRRKGEQRDQLRRLTRHRDN